MIKPLSLYIHIPFCKQKCNYCDFLSFSCDEIPVRKAYIKALCNQIASYKDTTSDYIVISIFIGGGTPSILDKEYISCIMNSVRKNFNIKEDAEITIEGNPDSLNLDKLMAYKELGINRLSIGLQSTNDSELKILGRVHNYDQFLAAYKSARQAGFDNINIDIMSALPGQSFASYGSTLAKVLALQPEHISSYSLIIEEGTPFFDSEEILHSLPDEDLDRQMYAQTKRLLKQAGFHRYEISNYAKIGKECMHNKVYWTGGDYIGLGIGAASFFDGCRYVNTRDIYEYIEDAEIISDKTIETTKDFMEEYMYLGLRLMEGISISNFYELFGCDIFDVYGRIISRYIELSLMEVDGDRLKFTDAGIDVSNQILAEFIMSDEEYNSLITVW